MQQRIDPHQQNASELRCADSQSDPAVGLDEAALDLQNRRLSWVLGTLLLGFGLWKGYALLAPVYLN